MFPESSQRVRCKSLKASYMQDWCCMHFRIKQVKEILDHPTNRSRRLWAFAQYLRWNIGRRLLNKADYVVELVPGAPIILSNRENYATLAYTCGLYDYDEMRLMIDYLRPGDVFGDFGANVGVYSVLAGSLGAQVLSVEPIPATFRSLQRNLRLNDVQGRALRCGLSDRSELLRFTDELGGLNHVATTSAECSVEVNVRRGDDLVAEAELQPVMLKVDVEGFELPLLRGASEMLAGVAIVIIELNGSGERYGYADSEVYDLLSASGFRCFGYSAQSKTLHQREDYRRDSFNSLFISLDCIDDVRARISSISNV